MEDKELKKQIIKDAQPLLDKIAALKKEIGEADEQEEKAKNEPSSGVKQWIEDNKVGRFKGKTLNREKDEEFTETADFTGKKV